MTRETPTFCVITAGQRPLDRVLDAIFAQAPGAEVVVAGCPPTRADIVPVPLAEAARKGQLGALRNAAVACAHSDWIAILDDDIVLQDGYVAAFLLRTTAAPIVTARVLLPDGTRYWDHAAAGGERGHVLLDPSETDPNVYMTGGGGWVMHRSVAVNVRWDPHRGFYAREDSDFASRCRAFGFAIEHDPAMVVLHAAPEYTSLGRVVLRRQKVASVAWVAGLRHDAPELFLLRACLLQRQGLLAEAADCVRAGRQWHPGSEALRLAWERLVETAGGAISGGVWRAPETPLLAMT